MKESWSYAEITENTEKQIRAVWRNEAWSNQEKRVIAWGILWTWDRLTWGSQKEGDKERIDKMTDEA
jgi:hypothetical protein